MPSNPLSVVFQQLRAASKRPDEELLTDFLIRRDKDALAALVERHAPMVWGVCCRVLRNPHDAEDAFQATFLVLVQKAASVVPRTMLANWLHGVARQTAVRLRATAAKQGWREVQMDVMREPSAAATPDVELLSLLDQELSRLPERFRALIVLCDLEGHTRKDVARQLGCPEGTVASGLARARNLLAKRLVRHGLAVSGGSLVTTLSQSATSACVPATVVNSTIKLAHLLAAGKAAGVISGSVATLTQGVLQAMLIKKIMTAIVLVLALGVAVITGGSLAVGQSEGTGQPKVGKPLTEKPVEPAAKREKPQEDLEVAWGKEESGLQLGLVLVPAYKATFRPGQTMQFAVKVRNVSQEKITITYSRSDLTPTITDAKGKTVPVMRTPLYLYSPITKNKVLQPGETVELYQRQVALEEVLKAEVDQKDHVNVPTIRVGTGKYTIAFPGVVQQDLVLSTGEVEFEVKDGSEKEEGVTAPKPAVVMEPAAKEEKPNVDEKLVGDWKVVFNIKNPLVFPGGDVVFERFSVAKDGTCELSGTFWGFLNESPSKPKYSGRLGLANADGVMTLDLKYNTGKDILYRGIAKLDTGVLMVLLGEPSSASRPKSFSDVGKENRKADADNAAPGHFLVFGKAGK